MFVCLCVCVFPSPGRIVALIVVIFGTRILCRPGKVIGYQKILSLASLAHAAQKKRAAGLQQPVRLLYRSVSVCVLVCVSPSPGRIVAPIVVIFGTRVLCRPGKVIGYQKILSLASLAHAAQKKRAAGLSSHSFAPIGVKIATRLLCHPAKILSRASLRSLTPLRKSAPRASEASKTSARSARVAPQG